MSQRGARRGRREEVRRRLAAVDADVRRLAAREHEDERRERRAARNGGQNGVAARRGAAQAGALVADQRDGKDRDQHRELRAREDGDRERDEDERVVPARGLRERLVHREHGPEETGYATTSVRSTVE